MKSVSRGGLMWVCKVSIFLLCLQDSASELLSSCMKKKAPLQRWSPVHRFCHPESSPQLFSLFDQVLYCFFQRKNTQPPPTKHNRKTQTKTKEFLVFLLKGSLTCPDKIFRRVPQSSLFSQFCSGERVCE